jgi:hypothetical protein
MWGRNGAPGAAWWAKGAKNSYSQWARGPYFRAQRTNRRSATR